MTYIGTTPITLRLAVPPIRFSLPVCHHSFSERFSFLLFHLLDYICLLFSIPPSYLDFVILLVFCIPHYFTLQ